MIRTEIDSMPQEMDSISREIMQKEIEEAALAKEGDASKHQLERVQTELAALREKFRAHKDELRAKVAAANDRFHEEAK